MDVLMPEVEIPSCPPHLWPEAKKEWKRVTVELERYGLISKIDRAALCLYVQSWAELVWAEKALSRAMQQSEAARLKAEEDGQLYAGGDGMTLVTTNGNVIYSPHWVIANKARNNVNRFLENFGMSPASRSRVTTSNYLQKGLFEGEEGGDGTEGGFAGI